MSEEYTHYVCLCCDRKEDDCECQVSILNPVAEIFPGTHKALGDLSASSEGGDEQSD